VPTRHTRVVHEDVDPAELLACGTAQGAHRLEVGHLACDPNGFVDRFRYLTHDGLVAAADHDLRALEGEPFGNRATDASRRAGDQGDATPELAQESASANWLGSRVPSPSRQKRASSTGDGGSMPSSFPRNIEWI
jgi:hypothetical protein